VTRVRGINYDTGFRPGGKISREQFDPAVVRAEMQVIASDLHCTAVRITGADPARLSLAAEQAAAAGLDVWFSPFPCELGRADLIPLLAECADRAEHVRRAGAEVVLVTGCELSLFAEGFLPGATVFQRIDRLGRPGPRQLAAFARLPRRLNDFLGTAADAVRPRFGGKVTYASGTWEPVDWAPFDIVSVDAYRDKGNAAGFAADLRQRQRHGKPVAVTEFGCCCYAGAADRGGLGWAIVDTAADPPRLDGDYVRDEQEQVRYLRDLLEVFGQEGVDAAFWFTFASYGYPPSDDPRRDLDLASYGLVAMDGGTGPAGPGPGGAGDGPGAGLGWTPRPAFSALASAYAQS
jgi:hypothetical protein